MNAELGSKKWLFAGVGLQFGIGYTVAFLVNFFGSLFTWSFGATWTYVLGWALVLAFALSLTIVIVRRKRLDAKSKSLKSA